MADDPIRAALREAAITIYGPAWLETSGADDDADRIAGSYEVAAAAIAAFLRALPAQFTTGCTAWGGDWPTLAAAVERAARQEGEG